MESRPLENGRSAVVSFDVVSNTTRSDVQYRLKKEVFNDFFSDAVPEGFNARTRVHEYGGGAYLPTSHGSDIFAVEFPTQSLKAIRDGTAHDVVTNETPGLYRYADFCVSPHRRLMYAVCEDHLIDEPSRVVNTIVVIELTSGLHEEPRSSVAGSHRVILNSERNPDVMFSNPRVDPTGSYICWIEWRHPNMPWDDTYLYVAKLSPDGLFLASEPVCVAGGVGESIMEPSWFLDDSVYVVFALWCYFMPNDIWLFYVGKARLQLQIFERYRVKI